MHCDLRDAALDPWGELAAYQAARPALGRSAGATVVFVGWMRDFNAGAEVVAMELEHYPGMTERCLAGIAAEAMACWPLQDLLILHRVGPLLPADPIVLVAVWSAHRAAAQEANRYVIEALKHRAPFWKRERLVDGTARWVESNTPG